MKPHRRQQIYNWIWAWVDIASALMVILSLGFWYPHWEMSVRCWQLKRDIQKRKKENVQDTSKG